MSPEKSSCATVVCHRKIWARLLRPFKLTSRESQRLLTCMYHVTHAVLDSTNLTLRMSATRFLVVPQNHFSVLRIPHSPSKVENGARDQPKQATESVVCMMLRCTICQPNRHTTAVTVPACAARTCCRRRGSASASLISLQLCWQRQCARVAAVRAKLAVLLILIIVVALYKRSFQIF